MPLWYVRIERSPIVNSIVPPVSLTSGLAARECKARETVRHRLRETRRNMDRTMRIAGSFAMHHLLDNEASPPEET